MVGPIDKSNNNLTNTVSDTEPLNTLGTANTNMNLHPGFLDLINGKVNQNIAPKDVIPTIPPADSNLDPDSIDDSTHDLNHVSQEFQDMMSTFETAYEGAQNRNQSAVLLLSLGNQMISLINTWMTNSFDQMLAQLSLTLSLAEEIAKQQIEQAEETKKSSEYAAIGSIVSGAAGLTVAVGSLSAQIYQSASAASAAKGLTAAESEATETFGLADLEKEQTSITEQIKENTSQQALLEKEFIPDLEKTLGSYMDPETRTPEQTNQLKNILVKGGVPENMVDQLLAEPMETWTSIYDDEIKASFTGALETNKSYTDAVNKGKTLETNQSTNTEAIEKAKSDIKEATKAPAEKAAAAQETAQRFSQGTAAQLIAGSVQNITQLISGAFNLVSADKKYKADMDNARITKLQAQSSAASQYMSTDKSQYDNFLQTLLTILGKLSDAQSSNTRAGG